MVVWTNGKYDNNQLSDWYNSLSCYIFPSSGEGWSCTPRESIYLGIPTIISDIPLHRDLSETGFYKVIPGAGKEPANFNGDIHGNWTKIETSDIRNAVLEVYSAYQYYKDQAQKGSKWIEDKWLNKDIRQQLIECISTT